MLARMRIVVAGFGNVLRGDDGFGVAVIERLRQGAVPADVELLDIGIGGIHLVQTLLDGADVLVVVDAVAVDRPPGTIVVLEPDVEDVRDLPTMERRDRLADMHYATPDRAMLLAKAMDVLPPVTYVVGCQPVDADEMSRALSTPVAGAVEAAAKEVRRIVTDVGCHW